MDMYVYDEPSLIITLFFEIGNIPEIPAFLPCLHDRFPLVSQPKISYHGAPQAFEAPLLCISSLSHAPYTSSRNGFPSEKEAHRAWQ